MPNLNIKDPTLLAAALEGLELQRQRVDQQIRQVKALLGRSGLKKSAEAASVPLVKVGRRKRRLSAAARARIAAAQKKRWAEYRKKKTEKQG